MTLYQFRPVANGLRTDHPIPDLPFVDDAHIPVDDPAGIEAVGRHPDTDMWGREDSCREGGWVAFTTDPNRHDLAWCVRWHPEHGRSVVLYRDEDAASIHMAWWGPALLFRASGYWWDGASWYRPSQVWDAASEDYVRRLVPAATTVTAAQLLEVDGRSDPTRGQVLQVVDVDIEADATPPGRWRDELALWAARRDRRGEARGLASCVVTLTAPELTGDQLVGVAELAEIAGVAASTVRAYLTRDEGDIPLPQASINGRSMWARPVAEEWAERRQRSPESVSMAVSTDRAGASMPVGLAEVSAWFTRVFLAQLWQRPDRRRRWALRWRNETAVRRLAEKLGWDVAASMPKLVPIDALAVTIRHAVLDEFAAGQALDRSVGETPESASFYGIAPPVARMLDWLIRHSPASAGYAIGEIIGEAERRLGVPRKVSEKSLRTALALDSKLDEHTRREFLDRVLTPSR